MLKTLIIIGLFLNSCSYKDRTEVLEEALKEFQIPKLQHAYTSTKVHSGLFSVKKPICGILKIHSADMERIKEIERLLIPKFKEADEMGKDCLNNLKEDLGAWKVLQARKIIKDKSSQIHFLAIQENSNLMGILYAEK